MMSLVPTSGTSGHNDSLGHVGGYCDTTASILGREDRVDRNLFLLLEDVLHFNVIARGKWGRSKTKHM